MRLLSRWLVFDLILGLLAVAGLAFTTGWVRKAAGFLLFMALIWVPWDVATQRRCELT